MISVVIPLYNKELYIKDTILKVLNQTFERFEIIVINDGSTDFSAYIVEKIEDPRIRIVHKNNGGVSSARNLGIEKAIFPYIAFLDADDSWMPNHLEEIISLIKAYGNQADVFVTNFANKYPNGKWVINRNYKKYKQFLIKNYFKTTFFKPIIHTSCVCVSKKALLEIGMFDTRFSNGEDIDLWVRLAKKYKIAYSTKVTEVYAIGTVNNSNKKIDRKSTSAYYTDLTNTSSVFEWLIKLKSVLKFRVKLLLNYYY